MKNFEWLKKKHLGLAQTLLSLNEEELREHYAGEIMEKEEMFTELQLVDFGNFIIDRIQKKGDDFTTSEDLENWKKLKIKEAEKLK